VYGNAFYDSSSTSQRKKKRSKIGEEAEKNQHIPHVLLSYIASVAILMLLVGAAVRRHKE
jgi:hypothetical protein